MIIAIVMAGGKGERLKANCEKPLFPLNNKFLIDYVLDNLNQSNLDKIVIAVSPNTLKTKDYVIEKYNASSLDFNNSNNSNSSNNSNPLNNNSKFFYFETPGKGYVEDLSLILDSFNSDSPNHTLLFINSDLPLVNSEIIDYVLDTYKKSKKPALSVSVPTEIFEENNLDYSYQFNGNVPSGLNILLSQNVIQEEEELIIRCRELAFNVNTIDTAISITKFL
ncbi:MAG: NTP transferase domain-containing protein [Methanobacteriaceae archaeon]|nr:NTP transferase domain-containing protein [Methanobacteriaceae archaeon]